MSKLKLYFETDKKIFKTFMILILSLKEIGDAMILFNKDGMRIHNETDENFILRASWDALGLFQNYRCPEDIRLKVNLQDFYDCLVSIFKDHYKFYRWEITDKDNDNLYVFPID